jgi:hypothetical protein
VGKPSRIEWSEVSRQVNEGGYDALRRFIRRWKEEAGLKSSDAYVPLEFSPGEAFQFDWSHDQLEIG